MTVKRILQIVALKKTKVKKLSITSNNSTHISQVAHEIINAYF